MIPKFSLRAHKVALTCITSFQNHLVTSDRDGWIIVWNLASRRPLALWKGHDGHILTLKYTDMGLISHGRDSMIRIWDINSQSLEKCSRDGMVIGSSTADLPKPPQAEIPVNALNFCNVDFSGGLLITPATMDSENFDVYEVGDPFGAFNFKRILHNVTPQTLQKSDHVIEEIESSFNPEKRGGNGIIMRILFVSKTLFFVGYESGTVYGFQIEHANHDKSSGNERMVLFKEPKVTVVFSSYDHKPSPVLCMNYDSLKQELYTGSASKKLYIYKITHLFDSHSAQHPEINPISHNFRHYGIQCIQISNKTVLTGFWDGAIKGFTRDFEEAVRLERKEESIKQAGNEEGSKPAKKSLCMEVWTPSDAKDATTTETRKNRLRKAAVGMDSLLFVGYGDGLVSAFQGVC